MTEVTIYSKDQCPWCERAKSLLELHDVTYNEIKIGREITREEFIEQFPGVRTVPQIYVGDVRVGGFDDLSASIKNGSFQDMLD